MGAGGSRGATDTRRLSVENPSAIHLSEAATDRIAQALNTSPPPSQPSGAPQPPPPPTAGVNYQNYDPGAEEYWKQRINALKKTHDTISRKIEEEYDRAVSETAQMFQRTQTACITGKLPPCQDQKSSVVKCYKENMTQPLLCAKYVNDFNDCVAVKRSQVMATGA